MTDRLRDKVAIVTGAGCVGPGWGNGRSTAVLFAREGARVFAVDKTPEPMAETIERVAEFGGEITTHICDVTDGAQVAAMVDACRRECRPHRRAGQQCRRLGGRRPGRNAGGTSGTRRLTSISRAYS